MTILLPTLAVAFAAFCVWLTVRIANRDRSAIDLAKDLALMFGPIGLTLAAIEPPQKKD